MTRFLAALKNANHDRPPIWLMRQAGRYLPEYKELRKNHTLLEMFLDPKLIAEVTLMPVKRFGMDASILFSDILMIAKGMKLGLDFEEGPSVEPAVQQTTWEHLDWDTARLEPVFDGVRLIKSLSKTPLIGFCGGPFTVSTYLIEPEQRQIWMQEEPELFSRFLNRLADHSIAYLQAQINAGVDAIQIFDSWASLLDDKHWEEWSFKPLKKIATALDIPVIVFMRGSGKRAEKIAEIQPSAISIDGDVKLKEIRKKIAIPLQGNLDPSILLRPLNEVRTAARAILDEMKGDPGFIFNLGHGVLPTTPIEAIDVLVQEASI